MRLYPLNRLLLAWLFAGLLPLGASSAQEPLPFTGEANRNNINIRADATVNSEAISTVNKGDRLEVISEFYEWYKIRLPKGAPAYIRKDMVARPDSSPAAKVLKNRVNIRLRPKESSGVLGIVDKNEIVTICGEAGNWYKIEPAYNSFGWMHKRFVDKISGVLEASDAKMPVPAQPEEKDKGPTQDNSVIQGIVRPCGKIFGRPATHKLITPDNKVFLLKGDKRELNALNYQKVKVTGKIASFPKQKYPFVEIKILEAIN